MKLTKNKLSDWGSAYAMIAPLAIGLTIFYIYPVFKVFFDSFFKVNAFNQRSFIGFENYIKMFQDETMWKALGNTFQYVLIIVPGTVLFALLLAVFLNTGIKAKGFFRAVYFIPAITTGAAVAMVWRWMYNVDYGVLNYFLNLLKCPSVKFLSDPRFALPAIAVVSIWMMAGYNMIILLAGIQGIPKTYYEAVALDGANPVQQFFHITLPLITPSLFFVCVTTLISTFQTFDTIYMMIDKSSLVAESTQSMVVYFYRNAFDFSKKGYASALAVLLFFIILIITAIQLKTQKKWVNYD